MDRSALLGMTTGAAVIFGFGIIWLLIGLFRGRPSPAWLRLALLMLGIAIAASIATTAARASSLPPGSAAMTPRQIATNHEVGRHFYLIFGIELAAIFVAVVVLNALHYPDYILSGIAIIVGVHFVPLAALFKMPLYYGTGFAGCMIGLVGFLIADDRFRQKVVALSFGLVLWITAACITWPALLQTL